MVHPRQAERDISLHESHVNFVLKGEKGSLSLNKK